MNIKTSKEIPPIYEKAKEVFGVDWENGIIFAYGDTIYCKYDLPTDLLIHEATHLRQQEKLGKDGAKIWWDRYFIDKDFRLSQEVEAYRNQYRYIKEEIKDRNKRAVCLFRIAKDLSSSIYGNMVDFNTAKKLIENK